MSLRIAVHGLRVSIDSDWPELVEEVRRDFAWFEEPDGPPAHVAIAVERRPPDLDRHGDLPAAFVTPRNVVFQDGQRTVVDYFGQAVSVLDRATGALLVQGEDRQLVHQAVYLFLLSRIGEHLDAIGLPRLHALGLSGAHGGVAVLLPSGGGKSTLALRALGDDRVRILSEDSPLIDRHGRIHPFPLRIGVNPTDAARLPEGDVRELERIEFHPKLVLGLDAFRDRIEPSPQPLRHIVIGRRTLGESASLEPVPRGRLAATLLREGVVGVGIYQGMEFVLQRGMRDLPLKLRPFATRAVCCTVAAARAQAWTLTIGRDHERNWSALEPVLR
jgi:hypothetical protein